MDTIKRNFCSLCLVIFLAACANNVNSGHLKEDEALTSIKAGTTTRAEVARQLGSPSSESSFAPKSWYYISSIKRTRSLFAPKIVDEHTVEIAFDSNDVVSGVKEYSLKDSKDIQIVKRVTPTEGQHLGFFEQIFANLGRFNKEGASSGIHNSHAPGTSPNGYPGGR